jgi:hypothetical protein
MVSGAFVSTVSVDVFPLPSYSYSSGAMYVWNMADSGGPVRVSSSTQRGQLESPTPTNCAIHQSGWGVVGYCNGKLHGLLPLPCAKINSNCVQEAWTLLTLVRAPMCRRLQAWASPLTLLASAAVEHTQL